MERQAKDGTVYRQIGPDEWAPVTRQAKDGTVYKKVGADHWTPLEQERAPAEADRSSPKDYAVAAERGVLFGARPFAAGLGGGIGNALGRMEREENAGLIDKAANVASAFKEGFSDSRREAQDEESELQKRRPGLVLAGDIGGAVLTAPLFAAKGLQAVQAARSAQGAGKLAQAAEVVNGLVRGSGQAAKIGGIMGGAQALGHADSAAQAIEMIGTGMATGAGAQVGMNAIGKAAPAVWQGMKTGAKKLASGLTGVSEREISTYAARADEVKKLIEEAGGSIPDAADKVREGITRNIQVTRQKLGAQIGAALEDPKYANTVVDAKPILQKLEEAISKIGDVTARFRPGEINELKNVRDLVAQSLDESGRINLRSLSQIKEELQALAKPSYNNGAAIFPKGDLAAKASKSAAGEARRLLNNAAPEIKAANDQLRRLHLIEEGLNKNLIRTGRSESALLAAGSGSNPRNLRYLQAIDEVTGGDAVRQAENLAAGRTFSSTQLLPVDTTGKALARMATGGGVGTVLGGPVGGIVGTAITSPTALKGGILLGRAASRAGQAIENGVAAALPTTPVGTGRAAVTELSGRRGASLATPLRAVADKKAPSELDQDSGVPANYKQYPDGSMNDAPIKGERKWMADGFNKLLSSADAGMKKDLESAKATLLESKRGKALLVAASDLKPGTPAMNKVMNQIKAEMRKGKS